MKDKLRYHGYSYKEFVLEIADCECIIPHTDPPQIIFGAAYSFI